MNLFPQRRTLTCSENKLVLNQTERCEECITEDIGFNRHMLILIKYIIIRHTEYQERSTQHSVIISTEQDPNMKRYMNQWKTFCTPRTNTTLQSNLLWEKWKLNWEYQQQISRHSFWGFVLAHSTLLYNLQTGLPGRLCCPSNQSWEYRNAAPLWPFPATAALNAELMVMWYSQLLQGCKGHLPSKNVLVQVMATGIQGTWQIFQGNNLKRWVSLFYLKKKSRWKLNIGNY